MKKIIIAGGTGFLGNCIIDKYLDTDYNIIVLTRKPRIGYKNIVFEEWDAVSQGDWTKVLEKAEVLINLAGKSVDCRYNQKNKQLIYDSRMKSTEVLGEAIKACKKPPKVWINSSSATIYRHSEDKEMDEYGGEIGKGFSVDVCKKWESTFNNFDLPFTRKVLIRTAIVLGKNGGALGPLHNLTKFGFGGKQGDGKQYFSWLHEKDFVEIIDFFIKNENAEGVFNLAAPHPVINSKLMRVLRRMVKVPFGLPLNKWVLEIGAFLIKTETELILKSRRVISKRLHESGYRFKFHHLDVALHDLLLDNQMKK